MAKMIYLSGDGTQVPLTVLAKNEDGTLELGNDAGELVIGKCAIGEKLGDCRQPSEEAAASPEPLADARGSEAPDAEPESKSKKRK